MGAYFSFLKKDPIKNIDVYRDDPPLKANDVDYSFMKNKCPAGTATFTYQTGKYGKEGNLDRTGIQAKELPRNKTDHVSYEPPQSNRPMQKVYDQMMTKPRYSAMIESSDPWMPYEEKQRLNRQEAREKRKAERAAAASTAPKSHASSVPPSSRAS